MKERWSRKKGGRKRRGRWERDLWRREKGCGEEREGQRRKRWKGQAGYVEQTTGQHSCSGELQSPTAVVDCELAALWGFSGTAVWRPAGGLAGAAFRRRDVMPRGWRRAS